MPAPPSGEICDIDIKHRVASCLPFVARDIPDAHGEFTDTLSLDLLDNYVAFSPESWQGLETYIRQLRSRAQQCQ